MEFYKILIKFQFRGNRRKNGLPRGRPFFYQLLSIFTVLPEPILYTTPSTSIHMSISVGLYIIYPSALYKSLLYASTQSYISIFVAYQMSGLPESFWQISSIWLQLSRWSNSQLCPQMQRSRGILLASYIFETSILKNFSIYSIILGLL